MSERTKLGLGIARVAIIFGRQGDVLLFPLALIGFAASPAIRLDVSLREIRNLRGDE